MKNTIYSILAITGCVIIGKLTAYLIGGLPSSLYGLICFTLLLHFKILSADRIKLSIEWAIKNMSVCFIPAGVGIIEHFELIQKHGLAIVFIIFISTFILLTIVGLLFERTMDKQNNVHITNRSTL
ncbi:CidA/LrgA family protein [Pseudocolwellia agarivorans]|uniref:CidA/LrgA family protein n=1 Tax=Pseudocolwellia agarivorans TaxID=1911682 RepID=UPI000985745F|nr:CidA/LrgA family protein [Pseudocolwellia agarivorans]